MRKQIWFGILVCVLSIIPGFAIGGIAALIYKFFTGYQVGFEPDFFGMRTFFGIETPGAIIQWLFFSAFPAGVQGGVAGAIGMFITSKVYKGPNIEIAAYTAGALYTGALLVLLLLAVAVNGWKLLYIEAVVQLIGLWAGLVVSLESVKRPNAYATGAL
jgi:hypothetical protein